MARRLAGNVGKYARGGSVAVQRRCDGIQSIELSTVASSLTKISVDYKSDIYYKKNPFILRRNLCEAVEMVRVFISLSLTF
jgi:hypothetical protein